MKIRTAKDVLTVAEQRGFKILVDEGPPPMPFLRGDPKNASAVLLAALKVWRLEIIEELKTRGHA